MEPTVDPGDRADGVELAALSGAVRDRVLALAAEVLATIPLTDVPPRLRPFARFAPRRRTRLAGGVLADALTDNAAFRARIGGALTADRAGATGDTGGPEAGMPGAAAFEGGVPEAAGLARLWLTRPPGWADVLAAATGPEGPPAAALPVSGDTPGGVVDPARVQQHQDRQAARREVGTLRAELRAARLAGAAAERAVRSAQAQTRATQAAAEAAAAAAAVAVRDSEAAQRRLRRRVEDLTAELAVARRDSRAGREFTDARLGLLLATLGGAVAGLSRELGLPAAPALAPADTVEAREAPAPARLEVRAESWDAPATLARFLALPKAHLLVDGYNVTKGALPTLPLARQRELLLRNLAGLAAQTGGEITVVFDGADVTAVPAVGVPGVRVRFSPLGVSADEVLRAMARAEPPGRPVVVVSSDREVADGVRRAGATAVGAEVLVRRLLGG